jgi:hypothetical protein
MRITKIAGYCALCRAKELEMYGTIVNNAGPRHKAAVEAAGCWHPASYTEREAAVALREHYKYLHGAGAARRGALPQQEGAAAAKERLGPEVKIDPEFEGLLPQASDEEQELLEASILREGCNHALDVWVQENGDLVLLDGHRRLKLCLKHGVRYRVSRWYFSDRTEARNWIVDRQLLRRNLGRRSIMSLRRMRDNALKHQGGRTDLPPARSNPHAGRSRGETNAKPDGAQAGRSDEASATGNPFIRLFKVEEEDQPVVSRRPARQKAVGGPRP